MSACCPTCGQRLPSGLTIPAESSFLCDSIEFMEAWNGWLESRKKLKKLPTLRAQALWLKRLESWGLERAIAALNHSAMHSWVGIFEPKPEAPALNAQSTRSPAFSTWELKSQLEAVDAEVREIRGRGTEHPLGWLPNSDADGIRLKALRVEQKRLRGLMQPAALQGRV